MCVRARICQTKALPSSWSWFPQIPYPPQREMSRHKHIMTGKDESSLKSPVAKRIFPLWMSAFSLSIQKSSLSFMSTPGAVLTQTADWHHWDFPTMLKGKARFVVLQRRMDRLFGRLGSRLIFQFYKVQRWHLWDVITDLNPASSTICKSY